MGDIIKKLFWKMTFYYFPMYITIDVMIFFRDFFMFIKLPFIFEKSFDLSLTLSICYSSFTTVLTSAVAGGCYTSRQLMSDQDTLAFKHFISSALPNMLFLFQQYRGMFINP